MAHSLIPPSSASVWAPAHGCPGWITMSQMFPETERSEAAERGTAAHDLAAAMIHAGARAGIGAPVREKTIGTPAPNGVVYDGDLFDAAKLYADVMVGYMIESRILGGANLGIEAKVQAPTIHDQSHGTSDFFLYCPDEKQLTVADAKFGYGVVDVFENWQLVNYAVGVMDTLNLWHKDALGELNFRFVIVQPNAFHSDGPVRIWRVNSLKIRWMIEQLRAGAARAFENNPATVSGPHCRYCRARHACVAAITAGPSLYEMVADTAPVNLSTAEMAAQLTITTRALAHLKSLGIAYEEQLKAAARRGEIIPGYQLEATQGKKVWSKPVDEVVQMGDLMGVELRKNEAITPAQACNRGLSADLVAAYSRKNQAGTKLAPVDNSHARKVFGP